MGILSRFLAPQPMLVAPLLPGPGSGDEEGWKVTSSGGDFRHVGLSGVFQAHWRCLVEEKGGKRRGGSSGGGETQVKPGKTHRGLDGAGG